MSPRANRKPVKPFGEGLSKEQRKSFADLANRADERRERKRKENARWNAKNKLSSSDTKQNSILGSIRQFFFGPN
jgi:hypothetical protein